MLGLPRPHPGDPGAFHLASAGRLESLLPAAGFADVRVEIRSMVLECESVAEYVQLFTDLAWKSKIASLSQGDILRFRDAVACAARPFMEAGRLRFTASSRCASALK